MMRGGDGWVDRNRRMDCDACPRRCGGGGRTHE